jgi:ABC-type Fe3+-siderophore transport system permease subunit
MSPLTARRFSVWLLALLLLDLLAATAALLVGAESVSIEEALSGNEQAAFILFDLRLPRVLAGLLVGGALAACGAAFQALLRNALASPFVLGVSGGGALGAVLSIVLGVQTVAVGGLSLGLRPIFAFAGCLLALMLIFAVARRGGHLIPQTLLLAGVVANAFFLSILGFLQYLATPHEAQEILRWMMGGLYGVRPGAALATAVIVVPGVIALTAFGRALNLLSLGEESARRLGVNVRRTRAAVFVLASLLTGAAVAAAGPIGFVGLFIPHGVRLLSGSDLRLLIPASFFVGGAFLVLADAVARVLSAPGEMPVGLITAAIGAPSFILILVRRKSAGRGAA